MKRKSTFLIPLALTIILLTAMPLCSSAVQVKSSDGQVASSVEEETQVKRVPVSADQVSTGTYPITVTSSTSMFRVTDCSLTADGGSMTARMTLGGTAYSHLYMGTDSDAAKADESAWIPYEENDDGSYSYTIPVEALNQEIDCAAFSTRSSKWFPRTLIFEASSLPEGTVQGDLFSEESDNPSNANSEENTETTKLEDSDTASSSQKQYPEATSAKESKIGYAKTDLEDGNYQIKVTMTGGSGRASIQTPASMTVKNGQARAEICWSSPNYDYMVVNGLLYKPINKDGNSVFEIPVTKFDGHMKVIADTTAMSQAHEIEYVLDFDSSQAELQEMSVKTKGFILLGILIAVIIAGFIRGRMRAGKYEYDLKTEEEMKNHPSSRKKVSKKKKKLR